MGGVLVVSAVGAEVQALHPWVDPAMWFLFCGRKYAQILADQLQASQDRAWQRI
jgi:hypothetical protein